MRCEISDRGPGFDPDSVAGRVRESGGRGLMLVDALAARWGTERPTAEREGDAEGEDLFCVWFELESPDPAAVDAAA
jgi:hypothetical protein